MLHDFHVADNNRLAPGMGSLDRPRIVAALERIGYAGALAAESIPAVDRTPRAAASGQGEDRADDPGADEEDFLRRHGSGLVSESYYSSLARRTAPHRTAETLSPLLPRP